MGLFRKEEKTKFIRDEEGRVIKVERTGDTESEYSKLKPKIKEYQHKQKMERLREKQKRAGQYHERAKMRKHTRDLKRKARRMDSEGGIAGFFLGPSKSTSRKPRSSHKRYTPKQKYYVSGGRAYPIHKTVPHKKRSTSSRRKPQRKKPKEMDWFNPSGGGIGF